jgi:hypothetical protein
MDIDIGLLGTTAGCMVLCGLVARNARHRGVKNAHAMSCFQSMIIGLGLGELMWIPFSVEPAPRGATHPLSFTFMDNSLAQLPVMGVMGCVAVVGTIYWGCSAVAQGLIAFKRWGIPLNKATQIFLPWTSLWTLAHVGYFFYFARSLVEGSPQ